MLQHMHQKVQLCIGDPTKTKIQPPDASELYKIVIYMEQAEPYRDAHPQQGMEAEIIEWIAA